MNTKLLILIGIAIFTMFVVLFFGVSNIFDNNSAYKVFDVEMDVIGIKQFYVGELVSFSVNINSIGNIVPWPTLRIYQNYVDVSSEPVYSRMYVTPIEPGDDQKSIEWRERTWNFPLESDDSIRFFDKGDYFTCRC